MQPFAEAFGDDKEVSEQAVVGSGSNGDDHLVDVEKHRAIDLSPVVRNRYFAPILTLAAAFVLVSLMLIGAGNQTSTPSTRKALIFIIDGTKGTVFETIGVNGIRAPNQKKAIVNGMHAACLSNADSRCAKTQSGAALGPPFTYQSAPGLASILTGVNAQTHQVYNTSFNAMLQFSITSVTNPSFLYTALSSGRRTSCIGTTALLTTVGVGSACTNYGVLDFECGASALSRCMQPTSCNLVDRIPVLTSGTLPDVAADSYTVAEAQRVIADGSVVVVVHINRVNLAATSPAMNGSFSVNSPLYAAQIFQADSLVGQLLSVVQQRAVDLREHWLVMGTSDHGGHGSTFGTVTGEDNLIPLWGSLYTESGSVPLAKMRQPATQMDIAPTVLEWFQILTPSVAANMAGRVQFLCGVMSGPNCTALGYP